MERGTGSLFCFDNTLSLLVPLFPSLHWGLFYLSIIKSYPATAPLCLIHLRLGFNHCHAAPVFWSPNWLDLSINLPDWLLWSTLIRFQLAVTYLSTNRHTVQVCAPQGIQEHTRPGMGCKWTTVRCRVMFAASTMMHRWSQLKWWLDDDENGIRLAGLASQRSFWECIAFKCAYRTDCGVLVYLSRTWRLEVGGWLHRGGHSGRVHGGRHRIRLESERKRTFLWS